MTNTIRVLLADDQDLIRYGLRLVLEAEQDMAVVGEANDGSLATLAAERLHPDVVLMDVRMPNLDGVEATRRITSSLPETKVLVLTTYDLDDYAFAALDAGASGFLLKDTKPADLVSAIRSVHNGDAVVAPRVTAKLIALAAPQLAADRSDGTDALAALTEREKEVLRLIAEGATNSEIATTLFVAESTVKTHVSRILQKLDLRDRVQAVILAYKIGLVGR